MGIYAGFEGYRDPTEGEVVDLLQRAMVVLDANALLDLYTYDEPARDLALEVLESLGDQLWVPYQVMREFWRNRHSAIAKVEPPKRPLEQVRQELLAIVNGLRPDRERPDEIVQIRSKIESQLSELAEAIESARGRPLDVAAILSDSSLDPVLERLGMILDGKIGRPFTLEDETKLVDEGLKRFETRTPPGYADADDKKEQLPERGTGDFLFWRQALSERQTRSGDDPFIIVSGETKEDWRLSVVTSRKQVLGIRPELVSEAIGETGVGVILLWPRDFYRLMARLRAADDATSKSLELASSQSAEAVDASNAAGWSKAAYEELLARLTSTGNENQANAIQLAASNGGFVDRSTVYESAGFDEDRTLVRFTLPARRVALSLVDAGLLREDSASPLEAVYEGPGKAVGFRVPQEFVDYELAVGDSESLTWVLAAVRAAQTDPTHEWSVDELVALISGLGLRDLSTAKTPAATLRRDLNYKAWQYFVRTSDGKFLLRPNHWPVTDDSARGG